MRNILFFIVFAVVQSLSMAEPYDECHGLSGKHTSVTLLPNSRTPSFYVRNINHSFFILLKPEDVLGYLNNQGTFGTIKLFVKQISSELPLKRNIDLYFYVLSDNSIDRTIDIMVSDLLRQGKATVINSRDIWPNPEKSLSSINIYQTTNDFSGTSFFCTQDQETVFFIMDYIS